MKTEAGMGIPRQAPEAERGLDSSLEPLAGVCPANPLTSDFWPPEV